MHRLSAWGTTIITIVVLALPFVESSGVGVSTADNTVLANTGGGACPAVIVGQPADEVPGTPSELGVGGTTSDDLLSFAVQFNAIRVENCLEPIPYANFTWNYCMEQRLFWMAEDPSTDPLSAWGHLGSVRSDGKPSVGCDANIAGGPGNTGATVATKWWDSLKHRASLYRPGSDIAGACIAFAMTHGGLPNEAPDFTRAAARWYDC